MSWSVKYGLLMLLSITITYLASLIIQGSENRALRRTTMFASLAINLGVLFVFKYFNFFASSVRSLGIDFVPLNVLLPVGISFYTFQALGYTVDVYRKDIAVERNFLQYTLFVSFFPQLVAGPIERSTNLLPQFTRRFDFDYQRITNGIKLIAWGLFKKVVIADRLAIAVNAVYGAPREYSGLSLLIASVFFAYQIYCDFSGYADIAIGSAQVLGFKLMDNFKRPYFSKTISEFWKRWHISLSSWFKDYFYIPLGGNRVKPIRWKINLFLTFLVSGLWHGANWTYIVWGALHGFYLIVGIITKDGRQKIYRLLRINQNGRLAMLMKVLTTFALVCIAWVFFRARNIGDAVYILSKITSDSIDLSLFSGIRSSLRIGISNNEFIIAAMSIIFLESLQILQRHGSIRKMLSARPIAVRWFVYFAFVIGLIAFGVFGKNQFIYFQF
jgi:D-alanyl-lipoteichoic acid acyltransferase DltB (MBOAT superfamily)